MICHSFLLLLIIILIYASEQQPLKLSLAEIHEVIAEVCSESTTSNANTLIATSQSNHISQPATDVAISVLIKLVIDMYAFTSLIALYYCNVFHELFALLFLY